jgi:hypothetical protein
MRYLKLLAAMVGAGVVVLVSALTDRHIDTAEWVQVAIQCTTAAGVWMVANLPGFPYGKILIAATLVLLNGVVADLSGGITHTEWLNLGVAVLTALGVFALRNQPAGSVAPGQPAG